MNNLRYFFWTLQSVSVLCSSPFSRVFVSSELTSRIRIRTLPCLCMLRLLHCRLHTLTPWELEEKGAQETCVHVHVHMCVTVCVWRVCS